MNKGADKILAFRAENGLTQERLGMMLGVTKQAVQNWEAAKHRPDLVNFYAMRAIGIPVEETDFLNGETK